MKYRIVSYVIVIAALASFMFTGCMKETEVPTAEEVLAQNLKIVDKTKLESDLKIIDDSLQRWFITADKEPNGVRYVIHTQGSGPKPTLTNNIKFKYTGKFLTSGDSFGTGTTTYPLSGLILGWQTTLPLLAEGTIATLYVPSGLAYGAAGQTDPNNGNVIIPPNANIIFEIELLEVL